MADFLRDMDPAHRAFLAIFIAVLLKSVIAVQWERFKARQAAKPAQMRLRNGAYEEWGAVQRVEHAFNVAVAIWAVWIMAMLVLLAWHKLVHPII